MCYNMKFTIPCPQMKLLNEIHNIAQNSKMQKLVSCCTIKFIEKLIFLCFLILLNGRKIKFTSSIEYSSY